MPGTLTCLVCLRACRHVGSPAERLCDLLPVSMPPLCCRQQHVRLVPDRGVRPAESCAHAAEATLPYSAEAAAHLLRACVVRRHVEQQLGQQQPRAQAVPQRQRRATPLRRLAGRGRPLARRFVPCGAGLLHAADAQAAPVRC